MRARHLTIPVLWTTLLLTLLCRTGTAADATVPVLFCATPRPPTAAEQRQTAAYFAALPISTEALFDMWVPEDLAAHYRTASDLFFAGHFNEARDAFADIIRQLDPFPPWSLPPDIRTLDLHARFYLSLCVASANDDLPDSAVLQTAAHRYPDDPPSPRKFPPVLIEHWHRLTVTPRTDAPPQAVFTPTVLQNTGLTATDNTLLCHPSTDIHANPFRLTTVHLARHLNANRLLVVAGTPQGLDIALFNSDTNAVRTLQVGRHDANGSLERALTQHIERAHRGHTHRSPDSTTTPRRPWFQDAPAWVLSGVGISAAVTGLALGIRHGRYSQYEPAALSLQISGALLTATGIVLFVLPDPHPPAGTRPPVPKTKKSTPPAVGIQAVRSF